MSYKLSSMVLAVVVLAAGQVQAVDVFNMGGTRDPLTGAWTGTASLEMVPVGNAGNVADLAVHSGNPAGQGAVNYGYNIGKYEVTAGQYTVFLNAVATTSDTYGLYNASMWNNMYGCKIQQTNSSGNYSYSVAPDYVNRPVNFVSFWDAARFTNWLHNGQGNSSTETGAYTLNGYNGGRGDIIKRSTDAKWWIPSEDEWYKAAYHDKTKGTAATYFDYATKSNTAPGQNLADVSRNNANYYTAPYVKPIDSGKYTTVAGEFQNSASPYGTFDQEGNVWEWNDSLVDNNSSRGFRSGSFIDNARLLASSFRGGNGPAGEAGNIGFRVASVPEPGSISLLVAGAIACLIWWRRKR